MLYKYTQEYISNRVMDIWTDRHQEIIDSYTVNNLKNKLDDVF